MFVFIQLHFQAKHKEIEANWSGLIEKARQRKLKLDESYYLHRYIAFHNIAFFTWQVANYC